MFICPFNVPFSFESNFPSKVKTNMMRCEDNGGAFKKKIQWCVLCFV